MHRNQLKFFWVSLTFEEFVNIHGHLVQILLDHLDAFQYGVETQCSLE